jgi:protein TonB
MGSKYPEMKNPVQELNPGPAPNAAQQVGGDSTAPRPIYAPNPEYSKEARKAQLQGSVTLSAVVAADGTVHDVKVVRPLGKGLDEKAIEAVQHWRFTPAMKNGQPIDVRISLVVNFALVRESVHR